MGYWTDVLIYAFDTERDALAIITEFADSIGREVIEFDQSLYWLSDKAHESTVREAIREFEWPKLYSLQILIRGEDQDKFEEVSLNGETCLHDCCNEIRDKAEYSIAGSKAALDEERSVANRVRAEHQANINRALEKNTEGWATVCRELKHKYDRLNKRYRKLKAQRGG